MANMCVVAANMWLTYLHQGDKNKSFILFRFLFVKLEVQNKFPGEIRAVQDKICKNM
jgi:hypothetical protein